MGQAQKQSCMLSELLHRGLVSTDAEENDLGVGDV